MTQKCCICKTATVSHWIPVNGINKQDGFYPVCANSHCKYLAWTATGNGRRKLKAATHSLTAHADA